MVDQSLYSASKDVNSNGFKLFAGNANPELSLRVAKELGIKLGDLKASKFADGEIRIEIQ